MTYREKLKEEGWFVARGILDGEDICTAKDRLRLVCEHVDFCRERINIIREVSVPERDRIPDNQRRLTDAVRDFENCKRKSTAWYFDRLKSFDDKKSRSTISRTAFCLIGRGDWIRTSDLLVPNQARYQAALRPELFFADGDF